MSDRGKKRKRKNFFQQALKYHKKGIHGKGVHIDDDSYEYFLNVLKIINQEFESEEDKRAFVDNIFQQVNGNEISYSCNQVVSRVIENLLPSASEETLTKFMNIFNENIRKMCMDQFGSFIVQKLITIVSNRCLIAAKQNDEVKNNEEHNQDYFSWLLKVSKFVLNNLEEFIFNNYANRVMRTVVCCLIGRSVTEVERNEIIVNENISADFISILKDCSEQLLILPNFKDLPFENMSSGFLQIYLQCLATVNLKGVKKIAVKLLNECFLSQKNNENEANDPKTEILNDFSKIPDLFDNESCIRLMEVLLRVIPPKLFTQIYSDCFYKRLLTLACHPKANFAVQKLIQFSNEKTEFESMFEELSTSLEKILLESRTGVILQLCEGCLRHKTKQSVFIQLWMKCLGCDQSKEAQLLISPLTICMKQKYQFTETTELNVNLHGSLIMQCMLKFNKPIKVISSLLEMKPQELSSVLCNPKGCHIADAFFASEYIGEKSREKFFKTIQGFYPTLATSKHGSRVFDIIWKWASIKNRMTIASELLENEAKLSNSPFGRPIIYNTALSLLRRNKEEWISTQNTNTKIKKLFSDIVQLDE